jgi:hypothetical protein
MEKVNCGNRRIHICTKICTLKLITNEKQRKIQNRISDANLMKLGV